MKPDESNSHHGELPVGNLQLGVGALLLEPKDRVEVAAGLPGRRRGVAALLCPGIHAVVAGEVKFLRHALTGTAARCPVGEDPRKQAPAVGEGEKGKEASGWRLFFFVLPPLPLSTHPQEASRNTAKMPTCQLNISPRRIFFFFCEDVTSQLDIPDGTVQNRTCHSKIPFKKIACLDSSKFWNQ